MRYIIVVAFIPLFLAVSVVLSSAESTGAQIGSGVGSVVGSAVYFPFKASFCILGGVSSGFALLFAGKQAAEKVADTTCRGTWAISPEVVQGKETVHFTGGK